MKKQSQRLSEKTKIEQESQGLFKVKEEYDSNQMQVEDDPRIQMSEEKGSSSLSYEVESQVQAKEKKIKKYGRNSKDPQNLKKIAFVLKELLTVNQLLTIKNISFLLCEILSKPSFEHKMKTMGYQVKREDINLLINEKQYQRSHSLEVDSGIVRNVRRRLYDAMNVMISAGLITKNQKKFRISMKGLKLEESFEEINYSDLNSKIQSTMETMNKMAIQVQSKQKSIQLKRQELKRAKLKYSLLENDMKRKNLTKKGRSNKIFFPILAVGCDPHMKIQLQSSKIYMENSKHFEVHNEMSLLKDLYDLSSILISNIGKKQQNLNQ